VKRGANKQSQIPIGKQTFFWGRLKKPLKDILSKYYLVGLFPSLNGFGFSFWVGVGGRGGCPSLSQR